MYLLVSFAVPTAGHDRHQIQLNACLYSLKASIRV